MSQVREALELVSHVLHELTSATVQISNSLAAIAVTTSDTNRQVSELRQAFLEFTKESRHRGTTFENELLNHRLKIQDIERELRVQ